MNWKAAANFKKHVVSFNEASTAPPDLFGNHFDPDPVGEHRFVTMGRSSSGRLW
jgi:uncharacterized DUF497 family protein